MQFAAPPGISHSNFARHTAGRRERNPYLAHLPRSRPGLDRSSPEALRRPSPSGSSWSVRSTRSIRPRSTSACLLSHGSLSADQSGHQAAHGHGSPGQYPHFHPDDRWKPARVQDCGFKQMAEPQHGGIVGTISSLRSTQTNRRIDSLLWRVPRHRGVRKVELVL
jgi:hypothetical protein